MPIPDVLSTPELAALVGLSRKTVWLRGQNNPRWSACVIGQTRRSTDWSRARLIAAGILCPPVADPKPAGLSFDVVLSGLSIQAAG